MLIQKYLLYNFITTLPSCSIDDTVAAVLQIFEQKQCDRLIVTDKQQVPIGFLNAASVFSYCLQEIKSDNQQKDKISRSQQLVSSISENFIKPINPIVVSLGLEKLHSLLSSLSEEKDGTSNCVIVDSEGKYLGILNFSGLLKHLMEENKSQEDNSKQKKKSPYKNSKKLASYGEQATDVKLLSGEYKSEVINNYLNCQKAECKLILQLLEKLPLPLMLQTNSGEVVTQNPAWWEQLGTLQDPEGVRKQVDFILNPQQNYNYRNYISKNTTGDSKLQQEPVNIERVKQEGSHQAQAENLSPNLHHTHLSVLSGYEKTLQELSGYRGELSAVEEQFFSNNSESNRCYFDSDLGTCICIVQVQDGDERVWQFTRIPLGDYSSEVIDYQKSTHSHQEQTANDESNLWLILATDVTEKQQLSQELAAKNADLIQLNRLKDEFLACISHELKTPLTAVLGLSRLLIDQQLGELNERQARYAGLIHQSGRHLMSVVNDILDLTRMETGQITLTLQTIKIRAVCERAIAEAKSLHKQNNKTNVKSQTDPSSAIEHNVTLSIEPELDEIVADELRLRQMILHLLSNALKFTDIEGDIGLSVNRWEGWIALTIWDTGIGIPEHQQHLIFQKFRQLENPLTRQFEGAGLGLVLTRALARLHGGDVSFLSTEGKGSQFTILLPPSPPNTGINESNGKHFGIQEKEPVSKNAKTSHHQPIFSQRLVMIVEPVARYIEDFTEHLSRLGYRIVVARSGCEALEKARRLQPKVIFLNPFLSNLSGWDVLTLIKSDAMTRDIPIIVTATGAEKGKAFSRQADGFLSLPVQQQHLEPLLENLCGTLDLEVTDNDKDAGTVVESSNPLQVLRLVNSDLQSLHPHPSLLEHRVIEVDNLEQAELMARVWHFDVVLLDSKITQPEIYLQQLSKKKRLASLPLVTCSPETTQAAFGISDLSVFPCLSPLNPSKGSKSNSKSTLLSVLQIAAGVCCPPNILVVDLVDISSCVSSRKSDTLQSQTNPGKKSHRQKKASPSDISTSLGNEWFQALIQYFQTAGFKAAMSRSWMELNEQIRYHSTDLLLLCLSDVEGQEQVDYILEQIDKLPIDLPPVIVIDRQVNESHISKKRKSKSVPIQKVLNAISTETLPRSVSMEDLLHRINNALNITQDALVDK
ncbi:MAG: ATP-binding protein [Cyanobacteria bacterium P01_A01_bin.45]